MSRVVDADPTRGAGTCDVDGLAMVDIESEQVVSVRFSIVLQMLLSYLCCPGRWYGRRYRGVRGVEALLRKRGPRCQPQRVPGMTVEESLRPGSWSIFR